MLDILKRTASEYGDDNVPLMAAALAYFSVFSLAPLLVIVIAVLVFFGAGGAQDTVLNLVSNVVGEQGAGMVETMIEAQAEEGGGTFATITSTVILLFGATTLFAQLERVLNVIWKIEPDPETKMGTVKKLVMTRVRSLGLVLAIGVLLIAAFFLTTIVSSAVSAADDFLPGPTSLWLMLNRVVAFAALALAFALVFRLLPRAEVPWRATWIGAVVTALLFVLVSWGFGIYISYVAVDSAYGAAGALVVLLLWVYFSAQATLVGAEFTQVLARRGSDGIERAGT